MTTYSETLHIIRNPHGFSDGLVRQARNDAADTIERLERTNSALTALLRRLHQWDMLDAVSDGPYWRAEIDRLIGSEPLSEGKETP